MNYLFSVLINLNVSFSKTLQIFFSDLMRDVCGGHINLQERGLSSGILSFNIVQMGHNFESCTFSLYAGEYPRQISFHLMGK